jgi:hypothetical protein
MSIYVKTLNGTNFQTDNDIVYNDLLKYITIPPHPKIENYNYKDNIFRMKNEP